MDPAAIAVRVFGSRWVAEGIVAALRREAPGMRFAAMVAADDGPAAAAAEVVVLAGDAPAWPAALAGLPADVPVLLLGGDAAAVEATAGLHGPGAGTETRAHGWLPVDIDEGRLRAAVAALAAGLDVGLPGTAVAARAAGRPDEAELREPLTARELEVYELMAKGLGNRDIGAALGISAHTAKFHVAQILEKTGSATRTEAVRQGLRWGLIGL